MTGFGRAEQTVNDKTYLVEIKSLNGKQFEAYLKIPPLLKSYELEIRNMLQESLQRGNIDCLITIKQNGGSKPVTINTELIKSYYQQIHTLATELNIDTNSVLSALLRLPDVVTPATEVLAEDDWKELKAVIEQALKEVNYHRLDEGKSIQKELLLRVKNINAQEEEILKLEPLRKERMKDELVKLLEENVGSENYDANRLEQELIYYVEKIDLREEQVRLANHCEYFKTIYRARKNQRVKNYLLFCRK